MHYACKNPSLNMITDLCFSELITCFSLSSQLQTPSSLVPQQFLTSKKVISKYERRDLSKYWRSISDHVQLSSRFRGISGQEMEEVGVEGYEWKARDIRFNSGDFNRFSLPRSNLTGGFARA